ncbi:MAG TPA: MauE/DoxX family redox-associated membrane protein [Acidimicrobiales bacterium]|nr:MauE/DoxX family redox-associated membrane protein [Acidimicrobiales bacterium]
MNIPFWYGPFAAAAALLVAAGGAKIWRPGTTTKALRQAGLPARDTAVRVGAAVEVVVGVAALAGNTAGAAAVAMSYLLFAAFVGLGLRKGSPISTCGCFGEPDAAPTAIHLVFNLAAALVAAWAAVGSAVVPLRRVLAHQPLAGLPFLVITGVTGYLAYLAMSVLPRLRGVRA